jgi:hypothetical protein
VIDWRFPRQEFIVQRQWLIRSILCRPSRNPVPRWSLVGSQTRPTEEEHSERGRDNLFVPVAQRQMAVADVGEDFSRSFQNRDADPSR